MSVTNHDDYLQYEADQAEHERQECARLFDEFWKPLVCNDNGSINQDKLNAELWDCHRMMMEVPKVYDHVTNGRLSKPNYPASVVIAEYDDQTTQFVDECVREETADITRRLEEARRERDEATERHKKELAICLRALDGLEAERDRALAEGRRLREALEEWQKVARRAVHAVMAYCEDDCIDETLCKDCSLSIQPTLDHLDKLLDRERRPLTPAALTAPLTTAEVARVRLLEAVAEAAEKYSQAGAEWVHLLSDGNPEAVERAARAIGPARENLGAALTAWREAKP